MIRRVLASLGLLILSGCLFSILIAVLYLMVPNSNVNLTRVDVLIVLGSPTMPDGSLTDEQRERVNEGVREFSKGVSSHLIMTGGAAHNRFIEADAMAAFAVASGVPLTAIIEETQSNDTIQNIYFANALMTANGWHTAEVISSPSHLARAAIILEHYPALRWKTHAAEWPKTYTLGRRAHLYTLEALKSFSMRISEFGSFRYLPALR